MCNHNVDGSGGVEGVGWRGMRGWGVEGRGGQIGGAVPFCDARTVGFLFFCFSNYISLL